MALTGLQTVHINRDVNRNTVSNQLMNTYLGTVVKRIKLYNKLIANVI